ncbi:MAG: ribbon-helix-helix domain-containing protein [Actinomycetota bacterium]|nr:ribbon-helix-helix domain-containing protein [Actinomycetota bacterium]
MQIAIVLEDEQVEELDRLVPETFPSRAAAVRTAVEAWLRERRAASIDAQYVERYPRVPQTVDEVDSGRVKQRSPLPAGWADLEW